MMKKELIQAKYLLFANRLTKHNFHIFVVLISVYKNNHFTALQTQGVKVVSKWYNVFRFSFFLVY